MRESELEVLDLGSDSIDEVLLGVWVAFVVGVLVEPEQLLASVGLLIELEGFGLQEVLLGVVGLLGLFDVGDELVQELVVVEVGDPALGVIHGDIGFGLLLLGFLGGECFVSLLSGEFQEPQSVDLGTRLVPLCPCFQIVGLAGLPLVPGFDHLVESMVPIFVAPLLSHHGVPQLRSQSLIHLHLDFVFDILTVLYPPRLLEFL